MGSPSAGQMGGPEVIMGHIRESPQIIAGHQIGQLGSHPRHPSSSLPPPPTQATSLHRQVPGSPRQPGLQDRSFPSCDRRMPPVGGWLVPSPRWRRRAAGCRVHLAGSSYRVTAPDRLLCKAAHPALRQKRPARLCRSRPRHLPPRRAALRYKNGTGPG